MSKISGIILDVPKITGDVRKDSRVSGELGINTVALGISYPSYDGKYVVTPSAEANITLETKKKLLHEDIKVNKIPYFEVSNNAGGQTVFIGSEV